MAPIDRINVLFRLATKVDALKVAYGGLLIYITIYIARWLHHLSKYVHN